MKVPADPYKRSGRVYRAVEELTYQFHDQTIAVTLESATLGDANR